MLNSIPLHINSITYAPAAKANPCNPNEKPNCAKHYLC